MDRGAWRAIVHGVAKESDMTEQLTHTHTHTPEVGSRQGAESPKPARKESWSCTLPTSHKLGRNWGQLLSFIFS